MYGMSFQNLSPNVLHLSFGAFSSLTPSYKFRNSAEKMILSFDNIQGLYHELREFSDIFNIPENYIATIEVLLVLERKHESHLEF